MLKKLSIQQFVIIDKLEINFQPSLTILTGETGAGKSIILDAVMLILGGRADTSLVRAGCDEAYVEATFVLDGETKTAVLPILEAQGLE